MTSNRRNDTTGQIAVKVSEVFLQVSETGALGGVIRKFIQMAEPEFAVLPVGESNGLHVVTISWAPDTVNGRTQWRHEV